MNTGIKQKIIELAEKSPKEEICGLIYSDNGRAKVFECKNIAIDPSCNFEVSTEDHMKCIGLGRIIATYHSHPYGPSAFSEHDLDMAENSFSLPSYIYSIPEKEWMEYIPKSYQVDPEGRPFVWGFQDCFETVRTHFRQNHGIYIQDYDRDESFEHARSYAIVENFEREGFVAQPLGCIAVNDVFVFESMAAPQHLGIFKGNSRFLHHPLNMLSRIEILGRWQGRIKYILRHRNFL